MKAAYPIVITRSDDWYCVFVPDLEINTAGRDIPDAIDMARDAIGLWGICEQDDGHELPSPSALHDVAREDDDIVTLVDIDFDAYRRMHDNRAIRKNCTIPSWLNEQAESAGLNFSQTLAEALKEKLGLTGE